MCFHHSALMPISVRFFIRTFLDFFRCCMLNGMSREFTDAYNLSHVQWVSVSHHLSYVCRYSLQTFSSSSCWHPGKYKVWTKVSCCFAVFAKGSRSSMVNRWFTVSLLFPRSYPNTVLSITFLSGISSSGDKLSPWEEVYIPGIRLVIPFLIQLDIRFLIVFGCSIHLHSPSYPGMWHFVECFPRDYPNHTMICVLCFLLQFLMMM